MAFTIDQLIQAADKELKRREFAYPRAVEDRKMTREFADFQINAMREIGKVLRDLKAGNLPAVAMAPDFVRKTSQVARDASAQALRAERRR